MTVLVNNAPISTTLGKDRQEMLDLCHGRWGAGSLYILEVIDEALELRKDVKRLNCLIDLLMEKRQ